ncbi:MAG: DUF4262 domain-containing protein [Akkermansiaceae bacterium]|nr:DUF4262 domain-containing protein [Armatimonadota bacterium]
MFPEPEEDYDRKVITNIEMYGWHVVIVPEDNEGAGFAYTVGLTYSYGHAEIILFGLPQDVTHAVLNEIGDRAKNGTRVAPDTYVEGLLEDYDCGFVAVDKTQYREFLGQCRWLYGGNEFDALQCVWPDKSGRFPWDEGFSEELKSQQPNLGAAFAV